MVVHTYFSMIFGREWDAKYITCVFINNVFSPCPLQGSHRSGKSGNSGKILKTFSSKGNQGKTGLFQPKSGEKISNQGTFFPNHFQTFQTYKPEENIFKTVKPQELSQEHI